MGQNLSLDALSHSISHRRITATFGTTAIQDTAWLIYQTNAASISIPPTPQIRRNNEKHDFYEKVPPHGKQRQYLPQSELVGFRCRNFFIRYRLFTKTSEFLLDFFTVSLPILAIEERYDNNDVYKSCTP